VTMRKLLALALLIFLLPDASAKRPYGRPPVVSLDEEDEEDHDDRAADQDNYWGRVAHPNQKRFQELIKRGEVLRRDRKPTDAAAVFREAVGLEPNDALGHWSLASILWDQKQWAECARSIKRIAQLKPGFKPPDEGATSTRYDLIAGMCLTLSGDVDLGIGHYEKVIAGNAIGATGVNLALVHIYLADALQSLGRLEEAIDHYGRSMVINRNQPMAAFGLAVALDREEQLERAREVMLAGLKLDPNMYNVFKDGKEQWTFIRREEAFYYLGFGHEILSRGETNPQGYRATSVVSFRKYLSLASDGPWSIRARQHLASLGPTAFGPSELWMSGGEKEKAAVSAALLGAGPTLQRCIEGQPATAVRVTLSFVPVPPPKPVAAPVTRPVSTPVVRPPVPVAPAPLPFLAGKPGDVVISLAAVGVDAPTGEWKSCLETTVKGLKIPVLLKAPNRTLATLTIISR
jgi:tetratricopeptide (TPR) repeat protein